MANFEPPSFSLGLDLETDADPPIPAREQSWLKPAQDSSTTANLRTPDDDGDELQQQVMDSDPECGPNPPRIFKRLRRGTSVRKYSVNERERESAKKLGSDNRDDEIEEFSSQEDLRTDDNPSTQYHSVCSSSKIPLHGRGVLTTQSSSKLKLRKREQASDAPASTSLERGHNGSMFPKLTISPLRMFQLLDSDSDDPSVSEEVCRGAYRIDPSSKEQQVATNEVKGKASVGMPQNEDLWKDFCSIKSFHIPTPALDEVCEEYFRSLKDKDGTHKLGSLGYNDGYHQNTNTRRNSAQTWDLADPLPPSHHYFFHDDPRIRILVRSRLPNFSPLHVNNRGNQEPSASVIDYMSQFSNGEAAKQKGIQKINSEKRSTRGRKKSKKSRAEGVLHASGGWVDPKSSDTIPKDVAKRRVHASGQSAGHWYTSPGGKKVYVSKSGQELMGQSAYRHYRKESGGGFRKSKKKTIAKKKKG